MPSARVSMPGPAASLALITRSRFLRASMTSTFSSGSTARTSTAAGSCPSRSCHAPTPARVKHKQREPYLLIADHHVEEVIRSAACVHVGMPARTIQALGALRPAEVRGMTSSIV
eukprot:scaffold1493_cov389-Pinguiococcus_pyrenoidosus.AAC.6